MRLFSALLRFCLLYFLFTADKGLGKSADLSSSLSSSSSSSSVMQEKAMADGECGVVVQESVLLRLMGMMKVTLTHLQSQKSAEESSDLHNEDSLHQLPSMEEMPEELAVGGGEGSSFQRLLLALWESDAEKSQLRRELHQTKQEMDQLRQEFNQLKETMKREKSIEKMNATREYHLYSASASSSSATSASGGRHSPLSNRDDLLTEIIRSDLQKTRDDILETFFHIKVNWMDCNKLSRDPEGQKERYLSKNCNDLFKWGRVTKSGVYTIYPLADASEGVRVWCDMEGPLGGWTVILLRRHLPIQVNFTRGWDDYKKGFGSPQSEYWIGNEILHQLTSSSSSSSSEGKPQQALRVEMTDFNDVSKVAFYGKFSVGREEDNFPLEVGLFNRSRSSVLGDSLLVHNDMMFTTIDKDNDLFSSLNCALLRGGGGFWYSSCGDAQPTGPLIPKGQSGEELGWYNFKNAWTNLKSLTMKIKSSG